MWTAVAPFDNDSPAPSARSKHSATIIGDQIYLLGGRNGNLPLKDFWKYNLVTGKWQQLKPTGDRLPCLQEHTAVPFKENIFVFGGEVGFSAGTETPLWLYDVKANTWKKIRSKKGAASPKGRRGHSALIHKGSLIIYGGYQDLKGSLNELWAYHFETESWHLVSSSPTKSNIDASLPPPRHKHSAIIHDDAMWIYGGMTDLQERSDLWKWDINSRQWSNIKTKINPGPLHSHAVCKLPSSMLIFGGEKGGQTTNDLWRFSFGTELWKKITISGLKPQPRAESIAFTVSELLLNKDPSANTLEAKSVRVRTRTCASADRGSRHSSYLPNNRIAPSEQTFVFEPTHHNYIDGSTDLANQYSENRASRSFIQEISKLSQINIPRLNNKCTYTALNGCKTDSTESLLRQHASPISADVEMNLELATSTPSRGTMIKSKSAYAIKKKYNTPSPTSPEDKENIINHKKRVEFNCNITKIKREPISVPNFSALVLPTPVLTPVEAAKLVYLDTDEENELEKDIPGDDMEMKNLDVLKRGESYSSHLGYADNPLYQHMITSNSVKFQTTQLDSNVSSTSDYASIETVNRLSSASNYSVKTNTPQEENIKNRQNTAEPNSNTAGPFGFCNPNYMGPDIKSFLNDNKQNKPKKTTTFLNNHETIELNNYSEDELELQTQNDVINRNTKVFYRSSSRRNRPPRSLALDNSRRNSSTGSKHRAHSASGVEKRNNKVVQNNKVDNIDPFIPLYVFVMGGKEQGQVTVFQRPISIWKLKLF